MGILFGDGTGAFPSLVQRDVGRDPGDLVLGHFDADELLDVVVNRTSKSLTVLLLGPDGIPRQIEEPSIGPTGRFNRPPAVACGDLDRDGLEDLVVQTAFEISVFLSRDQEVFEAREGLPDSGGFGIVVADHDEDGNLDLVTEVYESSADRNDRVQTGSGTAGGLMCGKCKKRRTNW